MTGLNPRFDSSATRSSAFSFIWNDPACTEYVVFAGAGMDGGTGDEGGCGVAPVGGGWAGSAGAATGAWGTAEAGAAEAGSAGAAAGADGAAGAGPRSPAASAGICGAGERTTVGRGFPAPADPGPGVPAASAVSGAEVKRFLNAA